MKCAVQLLVLCLASCAEVEPLSFQSREQAPLHHPVHATLYSNMRDPQRLVIRDADTWSRVWAQMVSAGDPRTPPLVDFDTEDVVVAAMGERRVSGYSIAITEVVALHPDTRVVVTSAAPGPACDRAEIVSAPLHAVRISKLTGVVIFDERGVVIDCE